MHGCTQISINVGIILNDVKKAMLIPMHALQKLNSYHFLQLYYYTTFNIEKVLTNQKSKAVADFILFFPLHQGQSCLQHDS